MHEQQTGGDEQQEQHARHSRGASRQLPAVHTDRDYPGDEVAHAVMDVEPTQRVMSVTEAIACRDHEVAMNIA
ncbi:hypothetical protein Airi02_030720 [Actinoallomurus iriomotensis]|uniref:Uncharacterized protein n=1 Tax=Actinoallomurus iriomotensis TaxID=478107 RepID=A0A9W6S0S4_9ACTN|nr:hypothetical protein Airi02_030720 [Actinoallomurus iriomotensis]